MIDSAAASPADVIRFERKERKNVFRKLLFMRIKIFRKALTGILPLTHFISGGTLRLNGQDPCA